MIHNTFSDLHFNILLLVIIHWKATFLLCEFKDGCQRNLFLPGCLLIEPLFCRVWFRGFLLRETDNRQHCRTLWLICIWFVTKHSPFWASISWGSLIIPILAFVSCKHKGYLKNERLRSRIFYRAVSYCHLVPASQLPGSPGSMSHVLGRAQLWKLPFSCCGRVPWLCAEGMHTSPSSRGPAIIAYVFQVLFLSPLSEHS